MFYFQVALVDDVETFVLKFLSDSINMLLILGFERYFENAGVYPLAVGSAVVVHAGDVSTLLGYYVAHLNQFTGLVVELHFKCA